MFSRMWPACFTEAMLQNVVRRFEEQNSHFQATISQCLKLFSEVSEKTPFANVDHQRGALDSFFVFVARNQPAKVGSIVVGRLSTQK